MNNKENYFESFQQTPHGLKNTYYNPFMVKHRRRTSKMQLRVLEKTFETNVRPDANLRKILGEQLGMTPRSVQVWFQNRRAKIKKRKSDASSSAGGYAHRNSDSMLKSIPSDFSIIQTQDNSLQNSFHYDDLGESRSRHTNDLYFREMNPLHTYGYDFEPFPSFQNSQSGFSFDPELHYESNHHSFRKNHSFGDNMNKGFYSYTNQSMYNAMSEFEDSKESLKNIDNCKIPKKIDSDLTNRSEPHYTNYFQNYYHGSKQSSVYQNDYSDHNYYALLASRKTAIGEIDSLPLKNDSFLKNHADPYKHNINTDNNYVYDKTFVDELDILHSDISDFKKSSKTRLDFTNSASFEKYRSIQKSENSFENSNQLFSYKICKDNSSSKDPLLHQSPHSYFNPEYKENLISLDSQNKNTYQNKDYSNQEFAYLDFSHLTSNSSSKKNDTSSNFSDNALFPRNSISDLVNNFNKNDSKRMSVSSDISAKNSSNTSVMEDENVNNRNNESTSFQKSQHTINSFEKKMNPGYNSHGLNTFQNQEYSIDKCSGQLDHHKIYRDYQKYDNMNLPYNNISDRKISDSQNFKEAYKNSNTSLNDNHYSYPPFSNTYLQSQPNQEFLSENTLLDEFYDPASYVGDRFQKFSLSSKSKGHNVSLNENYTKQREEQQFGDKNIQTNKFLYLNNSYEVHKENIDKKSSMISENQLNFKTSSNKNVMDKDLYVKQVPFYLHNNRNFDNEFSLINKNCSNFSKKQENHKIQNDNFSNLNTKYINFQTIHLPNEKNIVNMDSPNSSTISNEIPIQKVDVASIDWKSSKKNNYRTDCELENNSDQKISSSITINKNESQNSNENPIQIKFNQESLSNAETISKNKKNVKDK